MVENNYLKRNALVREATPVAANVAGGANGVSEPPMACDTRLVDPAPLRQPTSKISPLIIKHSRDSRQPLHPHSCSYTLRWFPPQPTIHRNFLVHMRKVYHVVVVEHGEASTYLSSSKGDIAIIYAVETQLRTRVSKHRL